MSFLYILIIAGVTALGYFSYDFLSLSEESEKVEETSKKLVSEPSAKESEEVKAQPLVKTRKLTEIAPEDFPSEIIMIKDGSVMMEEGELDLEEGDRLIPLSVSKSGLKVQVQKYAGIEAKVAISLTNFAELVKSAPSKVAGTTSREPESEFKPETAPVVKPIVKRERLLPVRKKEEEKASVKMLSDSKIEELLDDTYEAVRGISKKNMVSIDAGEVEILERQKYQTGLVSFKGNTLFGVRTLKAKALIYDGEIVKWVWANSNKEIR